MTTSHSPKAVKLTSARSGRSRRWRARVGGISAPHAPLGGGASLTRSQPALAEIVEVMVGAAALAASDAADASVDRLPLEPGAHRCYLGDDIAPRERRRTGPAPVRRSSGRWQRTGHGFRNPQNYRLRLLLHCDGVTWHDQPAARLRKRTPRNVAQSPFIHAACRAPRGPMSKYSPSSTTDAALENCRRIVQRAQRCSSHRTSKRSAPRRPS